SNSGPPVPQTGALTRLRHAPQRPHRISRLACASTGPSAIICRIAERRVSPVVLSAALLAAAIGAVGAIGSDALWLVPLGRLVAPGHVPGSIPFATAPSRGWHDVPAGGQLVFWALYRTLGGLRGLVVAQSIASAVAFGTLAAGLRRESGDGSALVVALVVLAGSIPVVVVVGAPVYSLPLFSAL